MENSDSKGIEAQSAVRIRCLSAIEDGEGLVILYYGGHAPGCKRIIFPRKVVGPLVYARGDEAARIKSFRLDKITITTDADPAPWANERPATRQRATKVSPDEYFAGWAYVVRPELRSALGVTKREYIDKEKTAQARKAAEANGASKEEVKRLSINYVAHGVMNPPSLDFHDGDMFFSARGETPLQVLGVHDYIEVHAVFEPAYPPWRGPRYAYHVTEDELAEWLRTGTPPSHARIGPWDSYHQVLFNDIAEVDK